MVIDKLQREARTILRCIFLKNENMHLKSVTWESSQTTSGCEGVTGTALGNFTFMEQINKNEETWFSTRGDLCVGKENNDNGNMKEVEKEGCHVKSYSKVTILGKKGNSPSPHSQPSLLTCLLRSARDVGVLRGNKVLCPVQCFYAVFQLAICH